MKRKKKLSFSKGLTTIEGSWKFDNNVALSFDEHVNQSIPHYKDIQKYVCSLSEWFLKENSTIYDLGCSTGETIKMLSNLSVSNKVKMIGIDSNKQMIKIAKSKLILQKKLLKRQKDDLIKTQIEFQCKDLLKIDNFQKSNLFISILLFPFLNYGERKKILNKVYQALEFGGALICVDKVRANSSDFEDIFNQVYFDFKIKKKLSTNQILNKSRSLRSSMHLFNQDEIYDLFRNCKFTKTEVFFRWFNFIGFIAIK